MSEFEKMINGKIFNTTGPELQKLLVNSHNLSTKYNMTFEDDVENRKQILDELIPNREKNVILQGPVFFDYGINTYIGENTYINWNFTVLDCAPVKIGKNVFIGPNTTLATINHAMRYQERNITQNEDGTFKDMEYAKPITIEDNCWLSSNVTVISGITIGEGSVIGAGSVVTKDVPKNSFAAGNPCRVIREITEKDSIYLKKELL